MEVWTAKKITQSRNSYDSGDGESDDTTASDDRSHSLNESLRRYAQSRTGSVRIRAVLITVDQACLYFGPNDTGCDLLYIVEVVPLAALHRPGLSSRAKASPVHEQTAIMVHATKVRRTTIKLQVSDDVERTVSGIEFHQVKRSCVV